MNSYQKCLALGITGTTEEQFAAMQAIGLTVRPIKLDELLFELNQWDMLTKTDGNGGAERWVGSIPSMKAALVAAAVLPQDPTPEQQQAAATATAYVKAIDRWFSHVTNPRNVKWDTTIAEYAAPFAAMRAQFENSGLFKAGAFEAVYALGGGLLVTTLEQFTSQKTAHEQALALEELNNQKYAIIAATRTEVQKLSAKATAVNAWLDATDLEARTPAELQTYCDSLLASADGNPS